MLYSPKTSWKISKLKSLKCIMKKEIWQCTICHLPRKQVKSYIAEGLYAGFSISRKTHLILHLKWTQMHWAQLYFTEARFWVIVWGQRETKKSIPSKAPKWHTSFPPVHADHTTFFLFRCQRRTEDFSSLSSLLGEATRGKSKGQEGRKRMPPPTCFPALTAHPSPLHLPLYFINVSVCGFLGHTS